MRTAGKRASRALHTVRIPRGLIDRPVGLGTAVRRAAGTVGLGGCGGCQARAERLDAWLELSPREAGRGR